MEKVHFRAELHDRTRMVMENDNDSYVYWHEYLGKLSFLRNLRN